MSDIREFRLPDLGEGLPDATVVEWHVKVGESVMLDDNLVSMETAKAIVDVPSPFSGKLVSVAGDSGAIVITGSVLASFEIDASMPQRAESNVPTHHGHAPAPTPAAPPAAEPVPASIPEPAATDASEAAEPADAGTVVGAMQSSDAVRSEQAVTVGGVKAMPAVRALARKLRVDLTQVSGTGADGLITLKDVQSFSAMPMATRAQVLPPPAARVDSPAPAAAIASAAISAATATASAERTALSAAGKAMRTQPPSATPQLGQPTPLTGVRRNMARVMADAHQQVVLTTIVDDADIHNWLGKQDITARLVRALVTACREEPALNAWFDGDNLTRTLHPQVDLGIAVDSPDGLFVPVLRDAQLQSPDAIKHGIKRLREDVMDRSISGDLLKGATISLSNFGKFAGRYATPIVVPPMVAIVGAGKVSHDVVALIGGIEVHRRIPLSLSFDHRACTGGEAARFLHAMIRDLQAPQ